MGLFFIPPDWYKGYIKAWEEVFEILNSVEPNKKIATLESKKEYIEMLKEKAPKGDF